MTSSIKPEVVSQRRQRRTESQPKATCIKWWSLAARFLRYGSGQTDKQTRTHKQTYSSQYFVTMTGWSKYYSIIFKLIDLSRLVCLHVNSKVSRDAVICPSNGSRHGHTVQPPSKWDRQTDQRTAALLYAPTKGRSHKRWIFLPARRYTTADIICHRVSVCASVTRRYCIETAGRIVQVFWHTGFAWLTIHYVLRKFGYLQN